MINKVIEKLENNISLSKEEKDFILINLKNQRGNKLNQFPETFTFALGYEPEEENYCYVVKNTKNIRFKINGEYEEKREFILVCVVDNINYLVDGADTKDSWVLSET